PARSQEDITRPDNTTNNAPNRKRTAATQDQARARSRSQTKARARDPARVVAGAVGRFGCSGQTKARARDLALW
ncbi:MAG: hypothetical protein OXD37_00150, partial [Acidimicrobiaceae bacterium]|nr:hypothetical protein [Acidimicrobiaceae bacterium]